MGIKGLFKELGRKGYEGESVCLSRPCFRGKSIVVDASFLIYKFSTMGNSKWEYCGNFVEIFNYIRDYVTAFHNAGINLIAVTDGAVEK